MPNDSVYYDIASRCGGRAVIGVVCADGQPRAQAFNGALSEIFGGEDCPVTFCDGCENCHAAVAVGEEAASPRIKRGLPCAVVESAEQLTPSELDKIMRKLLFLFPVCTINVKIPAWVRSLPATNSAVSELIERVRSCAAKVNCLEDCQAFSQLLNESTCWQPETEVDISPADGTVTVTAKIKDDAFFDMLSETAGERISDESSLMSFVVGAAQARKNYDKVKDALECARVTGYGIVQPTGEDLSLEKPSVVRQGSNVGVKLKATAPSYHIVKVDVCGEVNPIMGAASQSEAMVGEIMSGFEKDPQAMWNTNLFGKSLIGMVEEGLAGKVNGMQEDTRLKLRKAITRIVNEGKGGVICILL